VQRGGDSTILRAEALYSSQQSDDLYRGTSRVGNPDDVMTSFQQQTLHLNWRALDALELNVLVPRVEIHNEARGQKDVDLEGLGDVSLFVDWGPWRGARDAASKGERLLDPSGLSLIGGLKFPTGKEGDSVAQGATPPALLQLGTGTYDPLLGFQYSGRTGDFSLFHRTLVQIAGGESGAGLRPATVLQTATGVAYELFGRVTPSLAVEGIFRDKDSLDGDTIDNTGSSLWAVTPGVSIRILDRLYLEGSVRIPVDYNVNRTQLVPGELWTVGVSWSF